MEKLAQPLPDGTGSVVAISRHPLHPMLVTFPIALLVCALPSDLAYWFFGDTFWARMSLWLLGVGTLMGILAGLAGTVELLAVPGIRRRAGAWSHFVLAVMLLSVSFVNWLGRVGDPIGGMTPTAMYLTSLGVLLVGSAGWLGGKLVFEHQIGTQE